MGVDHSPDAGRWADILRILCSIRSRDLECTERSSCTVNRTCSYEPVNIL